MNLAILVLLGLALTNAKSLRRREEASLLCLVLEVHERNMFGDQHSLECDLMTEEGEMMHGLKLDLPDDVVADNREALRRGAWFVKLPGASINMTHVESYGKVPSSIVLPQQPMIITVPDDELPLRSSLRHRRTARRRSNGITTTIVTHVRSLLVVRVSTQDKSPTFNVSQLASYYFDSKNYSVVRQYGLCSANWIRFKAFNTVQPVLDVVVPGQLASFTKELLWAAAWNITTRQHNISTSSVLARHVAFILPPGLSGMNWVATGTTGYCNRSHLALTGPKSNSKANTKDNGCG